MAKKARNDKQVAMSISGKLLSDIEMIATLNGFRNAESYLKTLHLRYRHSNKCFSAIPKYTLPRLYFSEDSGELYHGDSLGLLHEVIEPNSVDLIVTSPPFGLLTQKEYKNIEADQYSAWFSDFGNGFWRVLKDTGSLVIDIGGAWNSGSPTKSLYQFKLLLILCDQVGFKLAQDIYWWNPARMPSPAAWVTVARNRLTDSVNCVWWLSKTGHPKADNRKVLNPYKSDQRANIARKLRNPNEPAYKEGRRPSGHNVSAQWAKDNKGSIAHNLFAAHSGEGENYGPLNRPNGVETTVPSNLFAHANTQSQDAYRQYCRDQGLRIHPAPFPSAFPAFFIEFLTDKGGWFWIPLRGRALPARSQRN